MDHVQLSQDQLDWGVAFFSLLQRVVSKAKQKHYSGVQHTISPFAATVPFFEFCCLFGWLLMKIVSVFCFLGLF